MNNGFGQRIVRLKWKWLVLLIIMVCGFFLPVLISGAARIIYFGYFANEVGEKWKECYFKYFPEKKSNKRTILNIQQILPLKKTGIAELDEVYEEVMDYQLLVLGVGVSFIISALFAVGTL